MKESDIQRLLEIEKRIKEIAQENGLQTTEIEFEIVPAQRMFEAGAYHFPKNFSHWSFGRDYEKMRTIYEHTHQGIPYEQVWNFETPKALLVETNPFALNALIVAHVYGHVDFFLANHYCQRGRSFSDVAEEARRAADRFQEYEVKYGKNEVEKTIDAAFSIQWHQHPDVFMEEELDNEVARKRLVTIEREKLRSAKDLKSEFAKPPTEQELKAIQRRLRWFNKKTPPQPIYDLLGYIIRYSSALKDWQRDILTVIRNQTRALLPGARTKLLNEGWATYWHVRIGRQLFAEKLLTPEEHGIFNKFHSAVARESKMDFNWYQIGLGLFEFIKERWDKGQFGKEYDECEDPIKRAYWDTGAGKGSEQVLKVRQLYSDRLAVEEFFTDDFIHRLKLYLYQEQQLPDDSVIYKIVERNPEVIRRVIKQMVATYGMQQVTIEDSDYNNQQELYLKHHHYGADLDPQYRDGVLRNIHYLWGKSVHLETQVDKKFVIYTFDYKSKSIKQNKK